MNLLYNSGFGNNYIFINIEEYKQNIYKIQSSANKMRLLAGLTKNSKHTKTFQSSLSQSTIIFLLALENMDHLLMEVYSSRNNYLGQKSQRIKLNKQRTNKFSMIVEYDKTSINMNQEVVYKYNYYVSGVLVNNLYQLSMV